jgi:hypothetical protein
LVNSFEDKFGSSVYPEGVWKAFKGRVASEISRSVVALASFKGDFTVVCYLTFHICNGSSSFSDDQNHGFQARQGFLHAVEFSLTSMMNVHVF